MVFRISKIHTNADFTFSNNSELKNLALHIDKLGRIVYNIIS